MWAVSGLLRHAIERRVLAEQMVSGLRAPLEHRVHVAVRRAEVEPAVAGDALRPADLIEQLHAGSRQLGARLDEVGHQKAGHRPVRVVLGLNLLPLGA